MRRVMCIFLAAAIALSLSGCYRVTDDLSSYKQKRNGISEKNTEYIPSVTDIMLAIFEEKREQLISSITETDLKSYTQDEDVVETALGYIQDISSEAALDIWLFSVNVTEFNSTAANKNRTAMTVLSNTLHNTNNFGFFASAAAAAIYNIGKLYDSYYYDGDGYASQVWVLGKRYNNNSGLAIVYFFDEDNCIELYVVPIFFADVTISMIKEDSTLKSDILTIKLSEEESPAEITTEIDDILAHLIPTS